MTCAPFKLHSSNGTGLQACSGDMLLEALAACAGVTLRAVATALEIPVRGGTVEVEGDLDFRGTLGVSKEVPVGFQTIRLPASRVPGNGSLRDPSVLLLRFHCPRISFNSTPLEFAGW